MRTWMSSTILAVAVLGGCSRSDSERAQREVETQAKRIGDKAQDAYDKYSPEVKQKLGEAKDEFVAGMKNEFSKLEQKLDEIEARGDSKSKDEAAKLRARRDRLAERVDSMKQEAPGQWERTKDKVRSDADQLERDVDSKL